MHYAQVDPNSRLCVAVSNLAGEMIPLETYDTSLVGMKHDQVKGFLGLVAVPDKTILAPNEQTIIRVRWADKDGVTVADAENVVARSGGVETPVTTTQGEGQFSFSSDVAGKHIIDVIGATSGCRASVEVTVS